MNKTLINSLDFTSLPLGIAGVVAGAATAALQGFFDMTAFLLCLSFAILIQLTSNLLFVSAFIAQGGDIGAEYFEAYTQTRPYNGVGHLLRKYIMSLGTLALAAAAAIWYIGGWWVLIPGAMLLIHIVFSCLGTKHIARSPISTILVLLTFGPVAVISTTYLMARHSAITGLTDYDMGPSIFAAIIIGLYACSSHIMYNYQAFDTDWQYNKHSLVNNMGKPGGRIVLMLNSAIAVLVTVVASLIYPVQMQWIPVGIFAVGILLSAATAYYMQKLKRGKYLLLTSLFNTGILLLATLLFIDFYISDLQNAENNFFFRF